MNPKLEKYIPIVDMIGETFGPECEVILHDLGQPATSVVYMANSGVTGRKIGDSFTGNFITDVLLSNNKRDTYVSNYKYGRDDSSLIKSSTALIKDDDGSLIGAICINFSIEKIHQGLQAIQSLIALNPRHHEGPEKADESEDLSHPMVERDRNIYTFVERMLDNVFKDIDVKALTRKERIMQVKFLDNKEIFSIKGMVEEVASRLEVSPVTIYSYLDEIRSEKDK